MIRLAAAGVSLQGVLGVILALVSGIRAFGATDASLSAATAGWFGFCGAAVLAIGVSLWRGSHGARTPAVVLQLLLLGVSWYAALPSGQPGYGVPGALYCVGVLAALFAPSSLRWSAEGRESG